MSETIRNTAPIIILLAGCIAGVISSQLNAQTDPDGQSLKGKKVAILATDGFEQSELVEPRKALDVSGATTSVVSLQSGQIRGWKNGDWADQVTVDVTLDAAKVDQFDALLLPGGVMNPDKLRMNARAVRFVRGFFDAGKPVHELVDPGGTAYVMQAYCLGVDPTLTAEALPDLGSRLALPAGWTYRTRILDEELVVDTTATVATVLQDELENTYTLPG